MAALEVNVSNLFNASEHNSRVFQDAIRAQDIMCQVLQRVMNDLQYRMRTELLDRESSEVYVKDGLIDYSRYIAEFYGVAGFAQFIAAWKANRVAVKTEEALEEAPDNVVVFGGNKTPGSILAGPPGTLST